MNSQLIEQACLLLDETRPRKKRGDLPANVYNGCVLMLATMLEAEYGEGSAPSIIFNEVNGRHYVVFDESGAFPMLLCGKNGLKEVCR